MATVRYEGLVCTLRDGESVLDGLLRSGAAIPHSCKAGVCGSCLMRSPDATIPAVAQRGLKDSWVARGYFLACACHPEGDLDIVPAGADARAPSAIDSLDRLSESVLRVRLRPPASFEFYPGQYITVVRADGLSRSYSLAGLPSENFLELHVRRLPGGRMSSWLFDEASPGDAVDVVGPSGGCFYLPGRPEQPLLLAGTGTGLAPLYGIVRDALNAGHRGPVHLFHGALNAGGLYLMNELRELAGSWSNLTYTPVVLDGAAGDGLTVGALDAVVRERYPQLDGFRGFICGDPAIVQSLRKKWFLAGMGMRDILADAFLPAAATGSSAP